MTNAQFYIGIAIPSILVILGWLHQNQRLSDLRTDMRNDMRDLRAEMVGLRNQIHTDMVQVHERVAKVEERTR